MPGYHHPGDAAPVEEVLAGLHAEIAAQSPEHAALVTRYREARAARPPPVPPGARGGEAGRLARQDRIAEYGRHRDAGLTRAQAAEEVGVSPRTAEKYDAARRREEAAGDPP